MTNKLGSPHQISSGPGANSLASPNSLASLKAALEAQGHVAESSVLSTLRLALQLKKPLLLDGPSGSGKSHLAESYAKSIGVSPIRLFVHADTQREDAAYDWNYSRQLLGLRLTTRQGQRGDRRAVRSALPLSVGRHNISPPLPLFDEHHLIAKPLLQTIRTSQPGRPAVLILEGLDQSDASLDGVLLPFFDDYQLHIDGFGCLCAQEAPVIFITSRDARRISDPVRRRAIYQYCAFPSAARELRMLQAALPGAGERLSQAVIDFVRGLRISDLAQRPGMDQLIAWTKTLRQLDALSLDPELIHNTLGLLLKHQHELKPLAGSDASAWLAALQARAQNDAVIGLSS
jgi:MoxR-like ATPase